MHLIARIALVGALATVSACTTYYKVTDPSTQKTYYTTGIKKQKGGAVEFKDAATSARVTVQNSEVIEISRADFKAGTPR